MVCTSFRMTSNRRGCTLKGGCGVRVGTVVTPAFADAAITDAAFVGAAFAGTSLLAFFGILSFGLSRDFCEM